jgi:hypothetical protein
MLPTAQLALAAATLLPPVLASPPADAAATSSRGPKYLSWYTYGPQNISTMPTIHNQPYLLPGATGAEAGANLLAPGNGDLAQIARIYDQHRVPSLYTPPAWYRCNNATAPLLENYREILTNASRLIAPFVANRSVVGIFYGKETRLFAPFYAKKSSFYHDRLGTDTGKTFEMDAFLQAMSSPARAECRSGRSTRQRPTSVACSASRTG